MKHKHHYNLILIGHKSSGKTHFGQLLSQELGRKFIDTDRLIEDLYTKKFHEKLSCRQIATKIGEEGFRNLERSVISSLNEIKRTIISIGAGSVLNLENCEKLRALGCFVYLELDKETIRQRILNCGVPSFFNPQNFEDSFEKMYQERKLIYEEICIFKVVMQGKTEKEILSELKELS